MFFLNLPDSMEKLCSSGIIYEPHLCSRVRFPRSTCQACVQGCPGGAISWDKTLHINTDKCSGCGICISRCPNGVFWSRSRGDFLIAQEIERLLNANESRSIVFSCSRCDQTANSIIVLPCLGRLTENLLLAPFVFGASQVEIQWPECSGCSYEKCLSHLNFILFFGSKLAAMIGKEESCIRVNKAGKPCKLQSMQHRLSRRDLFRTLRVEAIQSVEVFLPEFSNSSQTNTWAQFVGAKRGYLLKLLRAFPDHIPTCVTAENMPLANIAINSSCVGCPVCTTLCPTGALGRVENTDGVDIYFRPDICVGCKICQEACLFQAISLSPTIDLLNLTASHNQLHIHLAKNNCHECTTEFWSTDQEICPTSRLEKGAIVLSMKGRV